MNFKQFLAGKQLNAWVVHDGMDLYVRRAGHLIHTEPYQRGEPYLRGNMRHTLDIANMNSPESQRGQGKFWSLLDWLDLSPPPEFDGLYLENVLNVRLAASLRKRAGVLEIPTVFGAEGIPCFYRPWGSP